MKREQEKPPIAGESVNERQKLELERRLANWRAPITTTTEQRSIETTPLFATGREEQSSLF